MHLVERISHLVRLTIYSLFVMIMTAIIDLHDHDHPMNTIMIIRLSTN